MKLFLLVLLVATAIGGFAGAEVLDTSFSILGAAIGGVGTAVVLLGLGAYFDAQEKKSPKLPPEMHGIFDRMITGKENPTAKEVQEAKEVYLKARQNQKTRCADVKPEFSIEGALKSLIEQDAEAMARGEILARRLIPHHAIKRDIIIAAYTKDFEISLDRIKDLSWSEDEKMVRIRKMQNDFNDHINGVGQLDWPKLDEILAEMKRMRADIPDIEANVRSKNPMYKMVDPL